MYLYFIEFFYKSIIIFLKINYIFFNLKKHFFIFVFINFVLILFFGSKIQFFQKIR